MRRCTMLDRRVLAVLLAGLGCGGRSGGVEPSDTDPGTGTTHATSGSSGTWTGAGETLGVAPADDASESGSEAESSSSGAPSEPAVHYVGRYEIPDPAHPESRRMGWSGLGAVVRFDGTGVRVTLEDSGQYFTVVVDSVVRPTLATKPGVRTYRLARALDPGEHTVEFYRRTEGAFGATTIVSVDIDGELLAPPAVNRRIESIGASVTAGFGNEGTPPCSGSPENENHYESYAAIAARSVGAELHTVAWAGKGVVYNYGDEDTVAPLPAVYNRTLAVDPLLKWDFSWQPDAVVVNLGSNDFNTELDPPPWLFVTQYVEFVAHLRAVYPNAFILVLAPYLSPSVEPTVEDYVQSVVGLRQLGGDDRIVYADINVTGGEPGCESHPTATTHAAMAELLVLELQRHLGW